MKTIARTLADMFLDFLAALRAYPRTVAAGIRELLNDPPGLIWVLAMWALWVTLMTFALVGGGS